MRFYEEPVLIDAPPGDVWAVLVDVARYPEQDTGMQVDGPLVDGGRATVHSEAVPARPIPVRVAVRPHEFMSWTGGKPLRLFRGHRTFVLARTVRAPGSRCARSSADPCWGRSGGPCPTSARPSCSSRTA